MVGDASGGCVSDYLLAQPLLLEAAGPRENFPSCSRLIPSHESHLIRLLQSALQRPINFARREDRNNQSKHLPDNVFAKLSASRELTDSNIVQR